MLLWVVKIDRNVIITANVKYMKWKRVEASHVHLTYRFGLWGEEEKQKYSGNMKMHEEIIFVLYWLKPISWPNDVLCVWSEFVLWGKKIFSLGKWASIGWFLYPRAVFYPKSNQPTRKDQKLRWKQSQTVKIERKSVKKARTFLRRKSIKHWRMEKLRQIKSRCYGTRCGWRTRTKLTSKKVKFNKTLIRFRLAENDSSCQCLSGSMFFCRLWSVKGSFCLCFFIIRLIDNAIEIVLIEHK